MTEGGELFKFNFGNEDTPAQSKDVKKTEDDQQSRQQQPAREIFFRDKKIPEEYNWDEVKLKSGLTLKKGRVASESIVDITSNASLKDSDLVPGIYEGGFKLWEGAIDLCEFLCQTWKVGRSLMEAGQNPCPQIKELNVLELGCGHGLPGILALLAGAEVHFQDFNEEVITQLTSLNAFKNLSALPDGRRKPLARFFAGEFNEFVSLLSKEHKEGAYDIILSSETLYNVETHEVLLQSIKQLLNPPKGVAYIASKTHYFGVGGGTSAFKKLVSKDRVLQCRTVWEVDDGRSTKREVLELTFPDNLFPFFL